MSGQAGGPDSLSSTGGAKRPGHRRERARFIAAGVVIALIVVFGVLNTEKVKVDWIVATGHTSLIVVIIVSFLLGAVAGAAFWRRRHSRSATADSRAGRG